MGFSELAPASVEATKWLGDRHGGCPRRFGRWPGFHRRWRSWSPASFISIFASVASFSSQKAVPFFAGSPLLLAVRGCARSPYAVGKGRECLCLADRPSAGCLRAAVQVCVCSLNCELLAHRGKVGREGEIPVLLHQPVASFLRSSATRASRGAQDASPRHLAWASVTRLPGVAHSWRVWAP